MPDYLDDLPEGERMPRPAAQRAGVQSGEHISERVLVASVLDGEALHDSLRDLAARGWTEAQLVELMHTSEAKEADETRWLERLGEIPRLVASAAELRLKKAQEVFGALPPPVPSRLSISTCANAQVEPRKPTKAFTLTPIDVGKLPRRSWLTYGLLLDGSVTVASAVGGLGKSAWALRLALAVAAGQSWGKWEVKERRRVLVINAEDGPDELRRRAAANFDDTLTPEAVGAGVVGMESEDIILVKRNEGYGQPIVRTERYNEVREIIRRERIGFVVVDPLIELSSGLNENDNADMDALMRALRDIAREFQIPILVIHHSKKGGDGGQDSSRGAAAIVNNARVGVTLGPHKGAGDGYYCKVVVVKSNYAPKGKPHILEFQSLRLDNGDTMARVAYVDEEAAMPVEFEHWPELLEMVRMGRNGEPWRVASTTPKDERLDAAMIARWHLPVAAARKLLEQGQSCGRLTVEELPTRYRPKVWRVGAPNAPLLPWHVRPLT